jgi:minor extracellular serine protease Vpr
VCVIDSGIDYNHPDLAGNMPDKLIWDAINDRRAGPENGDNGHGTHVAGVASSTLLVMCGVLSFLCVRGHEEGTPLHGALV